MPIISNLIDAVAIKKPIHSGLHGVTLFFKEHFFSTDIASNYFMRMLCEKKQEFIKYKMFFEKSFWVAELQVRQVKIGHKSGFGFHHHI